MDFDQVRQLILQGIPDGEVDISYLRGDSDHLNIIVASDEFQGKGLLEQHRMVMNLLKGALADRLHAVKIKTMDKRTYNKENL